MLMRAYKKVSITEERKFSSKLIFSFSPLLQDQYTGYQSDAGKLTVDWNITELVNVVIADEMAVEVSPLEFMT
ncbi:hypothetical protein Btru_033707 [Bulinus truncatus]|nr:hypothetical protein Btru_033707 [Bulinus truncatus]